MKRKARRIKVDGGNCEYIRAGSWCCAARFKDAKWSVCPGFRGKIFCEYYKRYTPPESVTTEDFSYIDNPKDLEV